MVAFSSDEQAVLESGGQRLGLFFKLDADLDDPVRLWLGAGMIHVPASAVDPIGAQYRGIGEILDLPDIDQLINGGANRVAFGLSGVSEDLQALVTRDPSVVRLAPTRVGVGIFNDAWQLLGVVHWLWLGFADVVSASHTPPDEPDGAAIRSVSVSVGSMFTGRRRVGLAYYTDRDQQRRSPGDLFCERTTSMSIEAHKEWPRF